MSPGLTCSLNLYRTALAAEALGEVLAIWDGAQPLCWPQRWLLGRLLVKHAVPVQIQLKLTMIHLLQPAPSSEACTSTFLGQPTLLHSLYFGVNRRRFLYLISNPIVMLASGRM